VNLRSCCARQPGGRSARLWSLLRFAVRSEDAADDDAVRDVS
jgi:hypothetical protein